MIKDEQWPSPDWATVEVSWRSMIDRNNTRGIIDWLKQYKSSERYQLRGTNNADGFKIYFESEQDALIFRLTWG